MELKPGYKQTEVGVIPEDWDCVHIGDVAETPSGATPSRAKQQEYFDGGTIPWVKTLDLNNSSILETDECVTPSALQQTSLRLYPRGSVLVAMYGGFNQIGRTGMLTKKATINQALTAIRPDPSRLSSKFLLNYLNFRVEYWKSVASSSRKDPNITGRDVREFPIALPPLREQEAAGEALQGIEDQIFMLGELIAKKTSLKQATMQELLTGKRRLPGFEGEWEVKNLGSLASLYQPRTIGQSVFSEAGYPVYGANGVIGCYSKFNHKTRQITISCRGNCGTVNLTQPYSWITGNAMVVNLDSNGSVDLDFFYQLLKIQNFRVLVSGSGQPQIIRGPLQEFPIRIPRDKAEQAAIAEILKEMEEELEATELRLRRTQQLKQGMMQQLLTGKIRLQ
jgi:type I restriction enzyme, S subunit